jgi:16S rRNA U516 pseudouridylate synthase RsuA-like enzyme
LPKEYVVLTPTMPAPGVLARVRAGIDVDGTRIVPHEFRVMRETADGVLLTIVIHEGLHRVVRRVMEEAGIPVAQLRRVRIGPLSIAGIPRGGYRDLTPGELTSLLQSLRLDRGSETQARPRRTRPGTVRSGSTRTGAHSKRPQRGEPPGAPNAEQ